MSTSLDYNYRSSGGNRIYIDNLSVVDNTKTAITYASDIYKSIILKPRNSDFHLFNDADGTDTDYFVLEEGGMISIDVGKVKSGVLIYVQAQTASGGTPAVLEILYLA